MHIGNSARQKFAKLGQLTVVLEPMKDIGAVVEYS